MKKVLISILIIYIAFIAFMPKKDIYYTAVNKLKDYRVSLSTESLSDNIISLKGNNILIFYDGIESVEIESFVVSIYLFINRAKLHNISISSGLKSLLPPSISSESIEQVTLSYRVWDPKNVDIRASGEFGKIKGSFNIESSKVKLLLQEPSETLLNSSLIRDYFKKSEGGYIYESEIR